MSFREVKAEELTMNPFTKIGKEWLLITAGNEEKMQYHDSKLGCNGCYVGERTQ